MCSEDCVRRCEVTEQLSILRTTSGAGERKPGSFASETWVIRSLSLGAAHMTALSSWAVCASSTGGSIPATAGHSLQTVTTAFPRHSSQDRHDGRCLQAGSWKYDSNPSLPRLLPSCSPSSLLPSSQGPSQGLTNPPPAGTLPESAAETLLLLLPVTGLLVLTAYLSEHEELPLSSSPQAT